MPLKLINEVSVWLQVAHTNQHVILVHGTWEIKRIPNPTKGLCTPWIQIIDENGVGVESGLIIGCAEIALLNNYRGVKIIEEIGVPKF